jgi:hypothetical protein
MPAQFCPGSLTRAIHLLPGYEVPAWSFPWQVRAQSPLKFPVLEYIGAEGRLAEGAGAPPLS